MEIIWYKNVQHLYKRNNLTNNKNNNVRNWFISDITSVDHCPMVSGNIRRSFSLGIWKFSLRFITYMNSQTTLGWSHIGVFFISFLVFAMIIISFDLFGNMWTIVWTVKVLGSFSPCMSLISDKLSHSCTRSSQYTFRKHMPYEFFNFPRKYPSPSIVLNIFIQNT